VRFWIKINEDTLAKSDVCKWCCGFLLSEGGTFSRFNATWEYVIFLHLTSCDMIRKEQERLTLTKMIAICTHYSRLHQCRRRNQRSYHIVDVVVYSMSCWNCTGHTWSGRSRNRAALKFNLKKINKLIITERILRIQK